MEKPKLKKYSIILLASVLTFSVFIVGYRTYSNYMFLTKFTDESMAYVYDKIICRSLRKGIDVCNDILEKGYIEDADTAMNLYAMSKVHFSMDLLAAGYIQKTNKKYINNFAKNELIYEMSYREEGDNPEIISEKTKTLLLNKIKLFENIVETIETKRLSYKKNSWIEIFEAINEILGTDKLYRVN